MSHTRSIRSLGKTWIFKIIDADVDIDVDLIISELTKVWAYAWYTQAYAKGIRAGMRVPYAHVVKPSLSIKLLFVGNLKVG